jgi:predicted RNase H-like HicB family nuclease
MKRRTDEEFISAGGGLCVFQFESGFLARWSASPIGLAQSFQAGRLVATAPCARDQAQQFEGGHHSDAEALIGELVEAGMKVRRAYTARFEQDEDGWWCMTAACGEHGTAITQGQTIEEAKTRTRDSIACLLDVEEDAFDVVEQVVSVEPM